MNTAAMAAGDSTGATFRYAASSRRAWPKHFRVYRLWRGSGRGEALTPINMCVPGLDKLWIKAMRNPQEIDFRPA